jgi:hypothetical protein
VLGRPRTTRDVDALIRLEEGEWLGFVTAGASRGFEPRIANAVEFARQSRVLLMRHGPSSIPVDLILAAIAFEFSVIDHAVWQSVGRIRLRLPVPQDLVIMKAVAGRPRDVADLEGLLDANPAMDLDQVRVSLEAFAEALEAPELVSDFDRLRQRMKKP